MTSGINNLRRRGLFQRVVALSSLLEAKKMHAQVHLTCVSKYMLLQILCRCLVFRYSLRMR